jgi:hypothetical protein
VLGRRPASVVVGRGPWLTVLVGRVTVRFSPLPTRGVQVAGLCRYDPRGLSWRSRGWISLAGPVATFLQLLALCAVGSLFWRAGAMLRYVVLLWAFALIASLVANLVPRRARLDRDRAAVTQRDGWNAKRAFALHHAGHPTSRGPLPSTVVVAGAPEIELPPHWAPADPELRRVFEDELRRALRPAVPGEDPEERGRLEAQLRAALTPPSQTSPPSARPERQEPDRAKTSIPPPGHPQSPEASPR